MICNKPAPPTAPANDPLTRLHTQGKRLTAQRALLLRLIEESDEHLDAQELYRRARAFEPNLNLATVYRTLNLLKQLDLVQPHYAVHQHHRQRFESKPDREHYHFTCLGCGRVIEFASPFVNRLRTQVKQDYGVELTRACFCFEGYCADCAPRG